MALGLLVVALSDQTALGVKGGGVAVFVRNGTAGRGDLQRQLQTVLVLIYTFGFFLEVVGSAVAVFPYIVIVVGVFFIPVVDQLVEIGTPAVTEAKGIPLGIVGIVYMADAHRHTIAAEADVGPYPDQVAGVAVHIARTGTASGGGGVVPVSLQAVAVAEFYEQLRLYGQISHIIVGRIELPTVGGGGGGVFHFVRGAEDQARIGTFIPAPDNIGQIVLIEAGILHLAEILDGGIKVRLVFPGHGAGGPGLLHLMELDGGYKV